MSTRVISDRELIHNLRFEVQELREHVAELGVKLARLDVLVESGEHSVRVPHVVAVPEPRSFYPLFCRACGESFESATTAMPCPACDATDDVVAGPITTVLAS